LLPAFLLIRAAAVWCHTADVQSRGRRWRGPSDSRPRRRRPESGLAGAGGITVKPVLQIN